MLTEKEKEYLCNLYRSAEEGDLIALTACIFLDEEQCEFMSSLYAKETNPCKQE